MHPVVPVLKDRGSLIPLLVQEINALVKLTHSLRNLPGRSRLPQFLGRQRHGIEKLLEATILECAQQPRPYLLACEALEDLELVVSVDEVFHVRAVDAQEQLGRLLLGHVLRSVR